MARNAINTDLCFVLMINFTIVYCPSPVEFSLTAAHHVGEVSLSKKVNARLQIYKPIFNILLQIYRMFPRSRMKLHAQILYRYSRKGFSYCFTVPSCSECFGFIRNLKDLECSHVHINYHQLAVLIVSQV